MQKKALTGRTARKAAGRQGAGGQRPYRSLALHRRGGVEWLTLDRPRQLNAIDPVMADELLDYFGRLSVRDEVRVVVMRAAGRHFCAGIDLATADALSANVPDGLRIQRQMSQIVLRMRRCPQPIVALVHGAACGAGFALVLAADVRYAAPDARMNVAMARIGLTGCDMGISYFLTRSVGGSNAAELMMSGRFIDAERALRIGLVSDVVAFDALEAKADALSGEMIGMSPLGLRLTKEGIALAADAPSLEAAIALEDRGQVLCFGPYMQEGVAAFRAKRAARYAGAQ
ncbi:MAG: enoyl-CoA hydratase/isomerase family protein [Rubrivivax sp.]|nr:enoyl-CoA hydratase/isomerase family protein [Rubrivivax sp.]